MNTYAARIVDGVVTQVIVGSAAWASDRLGGVWLDSRTKVGVGWEQYEGGLRPPAPFPSWSWDGTGWQPPVEQTDPDTIWDEASLSWVVAEDVL